MKLLYWFLIIITSIVASVYYFKVDLSEVLTSHDWGNFKSESRSSSNKSN